MELFNFNRLKRPQLIALAGKVDIKGRHRMRKRDLIQELRKFLPVLKEELNRLRKPAKTPVRAEESSSVVQKKAPAPTPREHFVDRGAPLALHYGQDRLVMLVRDPYWVFCYWELEGPARGELQARQGGNVFDGARWVLRLHAATQIHDVDIQPGACNWYLNVRDDCDLFAEIGIVTRSGEFLPLAASNRVRTPRAGMSDQDGSEWMTVEGDFASIRRHVSGHVTVQAGTGQLLAERFGVRGLSSLFFGASQRASRIPPK
jgi:hypothetical protein